MKFMERRVRARIESNGRTIGRARRPLHCFLTGNPYYIMLQLLCGGDGDGGGGDVLILPVLCRFQYCPSGIAPPGAGSTVRHRAARGVRVVPRPTPPVALGDPGDFFPAGTELGERGAGEGALPGTPRSVPLNGADPQKGGVNGIFGGFSSLVLRSALNSRETFSTLNST